MVTITDLDHLEQLSKQIKRMKSQLEGLRDRAGLHGANLSGMPHGSGVHDRVAETVTAIVDVETALRELEAEFWNVRTLASDWIDQQEDLMASLILSLRYLDGASWKQIKEELAGCGNAMSEDQARTYIRRYLKKNLPAEAESNDCVGTSR